MRRQRIRSAAAALLVLSAAAAAAPIAAAAAALGLVAVQPSADAVPANLLRLSLVFAAPVDSAVLPRLGLRHADGRVVVQPFLEQELWSPSGRILTILLHPGRVKSGLIAHDQLGAAIQPSDTVALTLDGREVKRWAVTAEDHDGPAPSAWRLRPVRARTRQPLVVELDAPVDGRGVDYLLVCDSANQRVAGTARLAPGERQWSFTPRLRWRDAGYELIVSAKLEDPSGNRLGSHFESQGGSALGGAGHDDDVGLPFRASRPPRERR